jgi:hypothetical protein
MNDAKYIGLDVHQATDSVAVSVTNEKACLHSLLIGVSCPRYGPLIVCRTASSFRAR